MKGCFVMTMLKVVPQKDWEIVKKYLTTNGVILVPEIIAKEVECEEFDGKSVEYDFGGDADCWVDVVLDKNHIALESLKY